MARRIFLHVGTMKSATTYLQNLFDANSRQLAAEGILWKPSGRNHHAAASLAGSRRLGPQKVNAWKAFCRDVRAHPGDVLVSSELFGPLGPRKLEQVRRELAPDELRVIITARDLTRVVPSHWQETTQNRATKPWKEWVGQVCLGPEEAPEDLRFWRHQYLPNLVRSWSAVASPGQLYLVTVPQDQSEPETVWRRFAQAVEGFPSEVKQPDVGNPSLGAVSAELMRRVNAHLGDIHFQRYSTGFKHVLAKRVLVDRAAMEPKPRLTQHEYTRIRQLAVDMVAEIPAGEVSVAGTLQDLIPAEWPGQEPVDPAASTDAELLEAAIAGLVGLGLLVGSQQQEIKRLHRRAGRRHAENR